MAAHGLEKLQDGPAGFGQGMLGENLGLPAPVFLGWVVTVIELGGGIRLLLGLMTRVAALANVGVLAGAICMVKFGGGLIAEEGVGWELDLALLAGALALALLGPGRFSLDATLKLDR